MRGQDEIGIEIEAAVEIGIEVEIVGEIKAARGGA